MMKNGDLMMSSENSDDDTAIRGQESKTEKLDWTLGWRDGVTASSVSQRQDLTLVLNNITLVQ